MLPNSKAVPGDVGLVRVRRGWVAGRALQHLRELTARREHTQRHAGPRQSWSGNTRTSVNTNAQSKNRHHERLQVFEVCGAELHERVVVAGVDDTPQCLGLGEGERAIEPTGLQHRKQRHQSVAERQRKRKQRHQSVGERQRKRKQRAPVCGRTAAEAQAKGRVSRSEPALETAHPC